MLLHRGMKCGILKIVLFACKCYFLAWSKVYYFLYRCTHSIGSCEGKRTFLVRYFSINWSLQL